ncbi:MAG: hypothetical protein ACTMIA_04725 [Vibrio sp.]
MPAEKLTKQRLTQIVIIMLLLIGAFTWRSFTYQNEKNLSCAGRDQCKVQIDEHMIEIVKTSLSSYELHQVPKSWSPRSEQGEITQTMPQNWSFNVSPNQLDKPLYVKMTDNVRVRISL